MTQYLSNTGVLLSITTNATEFDESAGTLRVNSIRTIMFAILPFALLIIFVVGWELIFAVKRLR